MRLRRNLELAAGLDVAFPTAGGDELPKESELAKIGHLDQTAMDRFALQHALSDSRGREDTAAFAPKHLGLVPKVAALWRADKLEVEPYVKYESLHATGTNASYEGALVAAVRGTYRFHSKLDGTLRVWTNLPVAGDDSAVAVVEPQIRGHFGAVMPILGFVVPFAGELTDPNAVGIRAALAARF
jgi:hypothetical protein